MRAQTAKLAVITVLTGIIALSALTAASINPVPGNLIRPAHESIKQSFVDRRGIPLMRTYANSWNVADHASLHEVPPILLGAIITAEDKRFYSHNGVDWLARAHALVQNIRNMSNVRGASTITEQVVRMLNPRPRTLWSKWLEGIEASRLEKAFSKPDILEFYLNQVPLSSNRRGLVQAARLYFGRDIETLSSREMLAFAVLLRSPSKLNPKKSDTVLTSRVDQLAMRMSREGLISQTDTSNILNEKLKVVSDDIGVYASHFITYAQDSRTSAEPNDAIVRTTLDSSVQRSVQNILDSRIKNLASRNVKDGAALVVDHTTGEIIAWVNGGGGAYDNESAGSHIDMVLSPRQPGSTMKPLLYAMAIDRGMTAATIIKDLPLVIPVSTGLHEYRNYSGRNYGPVRMREALGNSLNIPAVLTVREVGIEDFFGKLLELGFSNLNESPSFYGDGIALGNAEVSLYELVGAYVTLANRGEHIPFSFTFDRQASLKGSSLVFSPEATSIISDILSDPEARTLEFGRGSLLDFPVQTAVKTGTSTDYRDAWAVGYSHKYTVGVWMGNPDQSPMHDVTGSLGPTLVLRAIFSELNRYEDQKPLFISRRLVQSRICRLSGKKATERCPSLDEWFIPGTEPVEPCPIHAKDGVHMARSESRDGFNIVQPTDGLQIAMDPRIPDRLESLPFLLDRELLPNKIRWLVDGSVAGVISGNSTTFLWPLKKGNHIVQAEVWTELNGTPTKTPPVSYIVK
ncbi:MAG TPA: penicillin-binding protein 1C [Nitrospirae bacterium]|nr:penicillin-binding protein 1C [Nitrospirota bacterium]